MYLCEAIYELRFCKCVSHALSVERVADAAYGGHWADGGLNLKYTGFLCFLNLKIYQHEFIFSERLLSQIAM